MVTMVRYIRGSIMMLWYRSVQKMEMQRFTVMLFRKQRLDIMESQMSILMMLFSCCNIEVWVVRISVFSSSKIVIFSTLFMFISRSDTVRQQMKQYMGECRLRFLAMVVIISIFFIRFISFRLRKSLLGMDIFRYGGFVWLVVSSRQGVVGRVELREFSSFFWGFCRGIVFLGSRKGFLFFRRFIQFMVLFVGLFLYLRFFWLEKCWFNRGLVREFGFFIRVWLFFS